MSHLGERGVDSPAVCADMLLSAAIGAERLRLYMEPDRLASDEERATLRDWVKRAATHEPVQFLVGEAWFHQIRIEVDASTMIPRPATETLVEVGHRRLAATTDSARILDLCTGTACVSIALLNLIDRPQRAAARMQEAEQAARADLVRLSSTLGAGEETGSSEGEPGGAIGIEPDPAIDPAIDSAISKGSSSPGETRAPVASGQPGSIRTASVVATELVNDAVELARRNAARHLHADRIDVRQGSLYDPVTPEERSSFDLIISNPPYISDAEFERCPPNVREHEPATALRGGKDGLDVIRRVVEDAPEWLVPGGVLAIEMQYDQASAVQGLFAAAGFEEIEVHQDVDELDRVVSGRLRNGSN